MDEVGMDGWIDVFIYSYTLSFGCVWLFVSTAKHIN